VILVAGGTGRLGTEVVQRLLRRGEQVRVLTRSAARADALADRGAEVAVGDVRRPQTLAAAMVGVHVVVSAVHGFVGSGGVTPQNTDRDGNKNLIDAARQVGADVVLLSVVGAGHDHPMELLRMKAAAEQCLERSGVRHTIVRATAFLELWQELLAKGPRPLIFGRGKNPINFVSVATVAEAVVRVTTDPTLRGQVLDVVGPDDLTLDELAARVRPGSRPVHVHPSVLRLLARSGPGAVRRQCAAALVMDTRDMRAAPATAAT
jgi:uncharacterized protein YbjT (DUF2867 family)